jgi:hypothetical protein
MRYIAFLTFIVETINQLEAFGIISLGSAEVPKEIVDTCSCLAVCSIFGLLECPAVVRSFGCRVRISIAYV